MKYFKNHSKITLIDVMNRTQSKKFRVFNVEHIEKIIKLSEIGKLTQGMNILRLFKKRILIKFITKISKENHVCPW